MSTRLEALPFRHVLTLPSEPSAVRIARETGEQALTEWGVSLRHPTVGPALLILGELVTNTVRHAAAVSPQVTIICAADGDCPPIAVHSDLPAALAAHGVRDLADDGG
jgi:anti-sigma regulatory factor (Ser/Thr protein kinase)